MVVVLRRWELFIGKVMSFTSPNSPSRPDEDLSQFSRQLSLLNALLQAGLTPRDALNYARIDLQAVQRGDLQGPGALFLVFWQFALDAGASLREVLSGLARAYADAAQNTRQARSQMAGPRAATHLVMVLPGVTLLGGELLGYHTLSFLLGQPVGWILSLLAVFLMWGSYRWSTRLISRAQSTNWAVGMTAVGMAAALRSGASLRDARRFAQTIADGFLDREQRSEELHTLDEYEQLSLTTGVPLSAVLDGTAEYVRSCSRTHAQMQIDKLSVSLMVPLGVCVLPAFIAVGVVPMVFSVVSSTSVF